MMEGGKLVHRRGAIMSICLKNFLTFGACPDGSPYEFTFEPRINIVCGPNGLGKSSLVAAIILCCGGRPSFLKRGKTYAELIRRGETEAEITLTLHNPESPNGKTRFKRVLNVKSVKNAVFVDGIQSDQEEYRRRLRDFNIQPENLTQFLPQDRVSDIVDLKKEDLLLETEQALSVEVYEMHQELIFHRKQWIEKEVELAKLSKKSEEQTFQKGEFDQNIRLLKIRDKDLERLMSLRLKMMILDWKEKERERDACDADLRVLEKQKEKWAAGGFRTRSAQELTELQKNLARKRPALFRTDIEKNLSLLESSLKKDADTKRQISAAKSSTNIKLEDGMDGDTLESLTEEISQNETRLSQLEAESSRTEVSCDQNKDLHQLRLAVDELREKQGGIIRHLKDQQTAEQKLVQQLSSISGSVQCQLQRLRTLVTARKVSAHVLQVFESLQSQQDKYGGRVLGPLFLHIFPKEEKDLKYLENVFEPVLLHFLCDTPETLAEMRQEFIIGQHMMFSMSVSPPRHLQRHVAAFTSHDMHAFNCLGFMEVLYDRFDAPDAVQGFLEHAYAPRTILIGRTGDTRSAQNLITYWPKVKTGIADRLMFCTKDCLFEEVKTHNSGTVKMVQLQNPGLLVFDASAADAEKSKLKLGAELASIKMKISETQEALNLVEQELSETSDELRREQEDSFKQERMMHVVSSLRETLQRKKIQFKDSAHLEWEPKKISAQDLEKKVNDLNLRRYGVLISGSDVVARMELQTKVLLQSLSTGVHQICLTAASLTGDLLSTSRAFTRLLLSNRKTKELEVQSVDSTRKREELESEIQEMKFQVQKLIKDLYVDRGRSVAEVQGIFKSISNWKSQKTLLKSLIASYHNYFAASADKIDLAKIERMNANLSVNYEKDVKNQRELELELKIGQVSQLCLVQQWLVKLRADVEVINQEMGRMFSRLGYRGQLLLVQPDDACRYEAYGLDFKVQFHQDDPAATLTSGRQSGGERVLSIAIFLLALQKCSNVPFRIVDEINQGMDSLNERNIFQLVLDASSVGDVQYIFCSPKIPPDYEHDESGNLNFCFLMKANPKEVPLDWRISEFCRAHKEYLEAQAAFDQDEEAEAEIMSHSPVEDDLLSEMSE